MVSLCFIEAVLPLLMISCYAALSNSRSEASSKATKSDTSHSLSVTPAAIAGVVRKVP